ncbi:MAG: hypothetical protein ACREN8_04550 [Candidatus Dormibacteraceae bacterium]
MTLEQIAWPAIWLLISALQLWAVLLILGLPDFAQVGGFLSSGVPTWGGAVALLQLLLWFFVVGLLGGAIGQLGRGARVMIRRQRAGQLWGGAVLLIGICLLLAGLLHHLAPPPLVMSGGSLEEARVELTQ